MVVALTFTLTLACVAGAWKYWAQEKTGSARETRVSLSRAPFFPRVS